MLYISNLIRDIKIKLYRYKLQLSDIQKVFELPDSIIDISYDISDDISKLKRYFKTSEEYLDSDFVKSYFYTNVHEILDGKEITLYTCVVIKFLIFLYKWDLYKTITYNDPSNNTINYDSRINITDITNYRDMLVEEIANLKLRLMEYNNILKV